jgi:hypothetical protein
VDFVAADRARLPLFADLLVLRRRRDPLSRRLGGRLDGDGADLPLRALGRVGL